MTPPSNTLKKLAARLFADPGDRARFLDALLSPTSYPPALIWLEPRLRELPFPVEPPFDWQPEFVDRVPIEHRPGQAALHQQGAYYCLDISSVFAASVCYAVEKPPEIAVDVCASPGGKSAFLWRMFKPQLLVANEVIGKRTAALIANLQRCRIGPAVVVTADSSRLADAGAQSADLVVVDAPCSGQSLIARGKPSPGCFHPATINMNANRQRRILANAARLVAPGGHLAYITCTYSLKENETNAAWLMKNQPAFQPLSVPRLAAFQSHLAEFPCYRLWPQQHMGAGSFGVIFRNDAAGTRWPLDLDRLRTVWRSSGSGRAGFRL
jgi:16S rRNA C967 or C1407 C5-methylase (RsmB/RsmF family)